MQSLIVLGLMVVVGACVGYLVLQPISNASRTTKKVERFYMVDLVSLVLVLQIPLVFLSVVSRMRDPKEVAVAGGVLLIVVVAIWWRGVSLLSTLDIQGAARRILFAAFIVPMAILCSMALVPTATILISQTSVESSTSTMEDLFPFAFAGLILLPATIFTLRQMTQWVLREQTLRQAEGIEWLKSNNKEATPQQESQ